jgi:hypothetical protein
MQDLTSPAFPVVETDTDQSVSIGLTKHELGALMIAQGLVAKYNLKSPEDQQIIAQLSYELSATILEQFK